MLPDERQLRKELRTRADEARRQAAEATLAKKVAEKAALKAQQLQKAAERAAKDAQLELGKVAPANSKLKAKWAHEIVAPRWQCQACLNMNKRTDPRVQQL